MAETKFYSNYFPPNDATQHFKDNKKYSSSNNESQLLCLNKSGKNGKYFSNVKKFVCGSLDDSSASDSSTSISNSPPESSDTDSSNLFDFWNKKNFKINLDEQRNKSISNSFKSSSLDELESGCDLTLLDLLSDSGIKYTNNESIISTHQQVDYDIDFSNLCTNQDDHENGNIGNLEDCLINESFAYSNNFCNELTDVDVRNKVNTNVDPDFVSLSDLLSEISIDKKVVAMNSDNLLQEKSNLSSQKNFDLKDFFETSIEYNHESKFRTNSTSISDENEVSLAALAEEYLSTTEQKDSYFSNNSSCDDVDFDIDLPVFNQFSITDFVNEKEISKYKKTAEHNCNLDDFNHSDSSNLDKTIRCRNDDNKKFEAFSTDMKDIIDFDMSEKTLSNKHITSGSLNSIDDFEVDLTLCLKVDKSYESTKQIINVESTTSESDTNWIFPAVQPILIAKNEVRPNIKVKNPNESLFAKALSCKPKQDISALHKVLDLQHKICNAYFNLSLPKIPNKHVKENIRAANANECTLSSVTRRSFGVLNSCELM